MEVWEIFPHHWKEHIKIWKIAKFESNLLKTNEGIAPQSREILQRFVWWLAQTYPHPTIQTSVNFRNFEGLYLLSLKMHHLQIWHF